MGKEKLKNKKGILEITNQLGKFERLNQEEWKVLVNGTVQGLAPVMVLQKGKKIFLQVTQSGWVPLSAYLGAGIQDETLLSFIQTTLRVAHDCERYGLRVNGLRWNHDWIFVDPNGQIHMIYWPVTTLEESGETILQFYYSFCGILAATLNDNALAGQYAQYFYQRDYLELHQFQQLVQDILEKWQQKRLRTRRDEKKKTIQSGPGEQPLTVSGWLERPGREGKIRLEQAKTVIGRDPSLCKIGLPAHTGISREHAAILEQEGQYYLVDLNSKNGTFLRGERLSPNCRTALYDGDSIRIHDVVFIFRMPDVNRTISIHQMIRR